MEDQEQKHKILQAMPQLKVELEKHITHLRQLADKVDKVHRDCTISNVTASSAGISSVILSVIGGLLAPFTEGLSTVLTTTVNVLGRGAILTGTGSAITETVIALSVEKEVKDLATTGKNILEKIKKVLIDTERSADSAQNRYESMESAAWRERSQAIGRFSGQLRVLNDDIEQMLARRAETMNRGLRVLGKVAKTVFFGLDVYNLVDGARDLAAGGGTELSEKLRQQAGELEKLLQELNQLH